MDTRKRSDWGNSLNCSACFVQCPHTSVECSDYARTCRAWACGKPHPKTDHMSLSERINFRNAIAGAVTTHWGFVVGVPGYVFAILASGDKNGFATMLVASSGELKPWVFRAKARGNDLRMLIMPVQCR